MMWASLFAFSIYLQLPLLLVVISLVYSATRHDDWPSILHEALRWGLRMAGFLASIAGILFLLVILPPHLFWSSMAIAGSLIVGYILIQWFWPSAAGPGKSGEDHHGPQSS